MAALKYSKRIREQRAKLWPDVDFKKQLWHRKRNDGFTTIPRTMALIISIIDDLTKGGPAGKTYFELWCRSFDEMYVSLSKPKELAFCSGFIGQRAERTWAEKIRKLAELGFIKLQSGQSGPLSHALIMNPYLVIKKMHEEGQPGLSKEKYRGLQDRAHEIAATDLDDDYLEDDEDEETATAPPAPTVPEPSLKKAVPKKAVAKKLPIRPLRAAKKKDAA
ncbi:hypothetical protein [Bradyrhizobium sp. SZCCHNRI3042]|uniref:hypothetical protein n=1 Tax=Bradyrhizobium sp. SZCCHNRI3042 TaxID=3057291 RepID=UPI002915EBBB|nr:hypothetical protein [Bradyrhizobium sp. SZCCHNRI3042]